MTGRPPILESDPERVEKFLDLVRGGISPSNAAPECEIPNSSWKLWNQRGKEARAKEAEGYELDDRDRLYMDFSDRLQRARRRRILRVEQGLMEKLRDEDTPVRDRLAILARLDPENWGDPEKRIRLEHAGSIDTSGEGSKLEARIEEYERAFAALDEGGDHDDGD